MSEIPRYRGGKLSMHWTIVLGVVLVAFGTYLTFWGARKSNRSDAIDALRTSAEQYQLLSGKIDTLRELGGESVTPEDITEVDREFVEWATGFHQNRDRLKLQFDQLELEAQENVLDLSATLLEFYDPFFELIRNALKTYKKTVYPSLEYSIPVLPRNIISDGPWQYDGSVIFNQKVVWKLSFTQSIGTPIAMQIRLFENYEDEDNTLYSENSLWVEVDIEQGNVRFSPNGVLFPPFKDTPTRIKIDEWDSEARKIIRTLIEFQLIQLEES